jgi:two-component system phosphate regulon sensor histidine kinase PhoR
MAEERTTEELKAEVEKLRSAQRDTARLLIRRDLALSRANEQLRALDSAKSEFISVAAHQLRTPLSAIKWILAMLAKEQFTNEAERIEFIDSARGSVDRMIALVNDLLRADHLQAGKEQFSFVPLDLAEILRETAVEVAALASRKQIKLDAAPLPAMPVSGDREKLLGVFRNLLDNAVKYTPAMGRVGLVASVEGAQAVVRVTDTGIGIEKEQQPRLFSKFFRTDSAMRVDTNGTGLGLFFVRQVVIRHGGSVEVESAQGKGSTFTVRLPLVG